MKAPAGKSLPKNTHGWPGIAEYNIAARANWPQRGDLARRIESGGPYPTFIRREKRLCVRHFC